MGDNTSPEKIRDKNGKLTTVHKKVSASTPNVRLGRADPTLLSIRYRNDSWRLEEDFSYINGHFFSEESEVGYESGMEVKDGEDIYRYLIDQYGNTRIQFNDKEVANTDSFPESVNRTLAVAEMNRKRLIEFNELRNSM